MSSTATTNPGEARRTMLRNVRARHPKFIEALLADAQLAARYRGERADFDSTLDGLAQALRLMVVTDSFVAQAAFRMKARMQALGIPLLPRLMHRVAIVTGQISIGDAVLVHPGVYIPHGQIVIDGLVEIHPGVVLKPWSMVGLIGPTVVGPNVGRNATVGSGSKVLGQVVVGANSRIAANSVVLNDVPDGSTVVGSPAKVVEA